MHGNITAYKCHNIGNKSNRLIIVFLFSASVDVIEAKLIHIFGRGNDTDPVPKRVFLQKLFGEVLKVAFRQGNTRGDGDFRIAVAGNFNVISKLSSFSFDFYAVMQELLKVGTIKDTISGGFRVVDDEFVFRCRCFVAGCSFGCLHGEEICWYEPTEKITQQSY